MGFHFLFDLTCRWHLCSSNSTVARLTETKLPGRFSNARAHMCLVVLYHLHQITTVLRYVMFGYDMGLMEAPTTQAPPQHVKWKDVTATTMTDEMYWCVISTKK